MTVRTAPRPPRSPDLNVPGDVARWQRDLLDYLNRVYADLAATVTEASDAQPHDGTLDGLAGLDSEAGLLEQTGPDAFTKRPIGIESEDSIPTRDDCDRRYALVTDFDNALIKSAHTVLGAETLTGFLTVTDAAGVQRKIGVVS